MTDSNFIPLEAELESNLEALRLEIRDAAARDAVDIAMCEWVEPLTVPNKSAEKLCRLQRKRYVAVDPSMTDEEIAHMLMVQETEEQVLAELHAERHEGYS